MAFKKVRRSYHSTPNGWRLATFKEVTDGLETIKNKSILNKWDRARLLDGWITGPGYGFEMGNSFKGCLGHMLLIQTAAPGKEKRSSSILVREMLFVKYNSKGEEDAFLYFQTLATACRKQPREWKRLLTYHRLVWYIFSASKEAKNLVRWQVQWVTWIFICWEWQECMDLVIKKWKEIGDLKPNEPSLLTIVEHLMEEHEGKNSKATSYENSENANSMESRLDLLEKSLAELKKDIQELKEQVSDVSKKDLKELEKHIINDLKGVTEEAKKQILESGKKEERCNKKNTELQHENWKRMKSALEKYDVSMDGIQAFQRFRFYCIAGYLPRPSLRR